jgi:class 3 adenylate cyclase
MESNPSLSDYVNLSSKISTFMSIDVVNSTAMKSGEIEQDVIYTFLSYHKLIRELAYNYHGEIISISGDGMMCRFERPDDAVTAMIAIIEGIPAFNKRQNRLSHPFTLRIGLNTGEVMESQSLSAGQLISHTIDVAAKLQQACAPNQGMLSQETVDALRQEAPPLMRLGWDANLKTTAYQYTGKQHVKVAPRSLPNPVKVLVVEDDLTELLKLRKILWARRHDPLPVYTAAQAQLCSTAWKPHVILVSADLSWNAGWDLVKTFRADQAVSKTPIIILSGQSAGEAVERCFGLGANGFLQKPLEEQQIGKRLDAVLREFYL